MKKYLLQAFFLLQIKTLLLAQVEYLVQVNPSNCAYNIVDSLGGVKWISGEASFDELNKRYLFLGQDVNFNSYLYSVNALNGDIISNPPWIGNYALLQFDNTTGILYGIYWTNTIADDANFVSINPTNLTHTVIDSLNITSVTGDVTFDKQNHRFIFIGNQSISDKRLYCIDAITGNVITMSTFNNNVTGIQYDSNTGALYGLKWDNNLQTMYFVSIDIVTGVATNVAPIPSVNPNISYITFNEMNHRYTFAWTDNTNNTNYLYTLNAANGQVISNPAFPVMAVSYNLINFKYDNSTGILYALHWGAISEITGVSEKSKTVQPVVLEQNVPNPFAEQTTINYTLPDNATKAEMLFYNSQGKLIQSVELTQKRKGQLNVFANDLSSDIYTYTLVVDGKIVESKKMIKQ